MLAAAVAHQLDALGLGVFGRAGTDVFLHNLPADPGDAVGVWGESGRQALPFTRRPGFQIIVRHDPAGGGGRSRPGYDRAAAILAAFDGASGVWAAGTEDELAVSWCLATASEPLDLGEDENGALKWSVRFEFETPKAAA